MDSARWLNLDSVVSDYEEWPAEAAHLCICGSHENAQNLFHFSANSKLTCVSFFEQVLKQAITRARI